MAGLTSKNENLGVFLHIFYFLRFFGSETWSDRRFFDMNLKLYNLKR